MQSGLWFVKRHRPDVYQDSCRIFARCNGLYLGPFWQRRLVRIQVHDVDPVPVSGNATSSRWLSGSGRLVDRLSPGQDGIVFNQVAFVWRYVLDAAVTMRAVVPSHEGVDPLSRRRQAFERLRRIGWRVLQESWIPLIGQ